VTTTARRLVQLGRESIVYGFSGVVQSIIGVALIPLYTRVFSPSDFGVIALVNSLAALLFPLVVLGLDNSSARWFYDTDDPGRKKTIISSWFWAQAAAGCLIAALVLLFAPHVTALMFGSREHLLLVCLAVGAVPLATPVKVLGNLLRYQRRPWTSSTFSVATVLVTVGITIWLVLIRRSGIAGFYLASLIAAGVTAVAALYLLRNWVSITSFSWKLLKEMVRFGLPLVPAAVAYWLATSSDRFVLTLFWSESEVGLYSLGTYVASALGLVVGAFQRAFGPFAFSIHREQGSGQVYAKTLTVYAWGGCFLCTSLTLFAPMLLRVFTTGQYLPAASCVPFLAFSYVLLGARDIASIGAAISKRSIPVATSILIAAATGVGLNFLLDPRMGRDGAGIASMSACLVSIIYLFWVSQRLHKIPYRFGPAVACFVLSWTLIAVDRFCPIPNELTGFAVRVAMCAAFIPAAFVFRVARPSDVRRIMVRWTSGKGHQRSR